MPGIFTLNGVMSTILVRDIRFLAEGEKISKNYDHVPMQLSKVVDVLNKMPKLGGKNYILLSKELFCVLFLRS